MNIFKAVKESVSTRRAAEQYGIKVGRGGMACCPFHKDRTPSMKIDRNFYCFGCGAKGDVIAFVAKLFDLSPKAAAQKLATDFGLILNETAPHPAQKKPSEWELQKRYEQEENEMFWALIAYRKHLVQWREQYKPQTPEEPLHTCFVLALKQLDLLEYHLDVLLNGSLPERMALMKEKRKEVTELEQYMEEPTERGAGTAYAGNATAS